MSAKGAAWPLLPVQAPLEDLSESKPEGPTVTMSTAADEAKWAGFRTDAARVIDANSRYDAAVAESFENTYDEAVLDRVVDAVEGLRAARPSAVRLAQMHSTGGA